MRAELAAVLAKRRPCACGRARAFGERCRPCFVRRPLAEQKTDLERLLLEAETLGDYGEHMRLDQAYRAVASSGRTDQWSGG